MSGTPETSSVPAASSPDLPHQGEKSEVVLSEPVLPLEHSAATHPWGVVFRSLALGGVLGFALFYFAAFVFPGSWVAQLVRGNWLEMEARMTLIKLGALGLGLGGALTAAALLLARRCFGNLSKVERALWLLFPLTLLPFVVLLLHHDAWRGRHVDLLAATLLLTLVAQSLLLRSFASTPRWLGELWGRLSSKLPGFLRRHAPLLVVLAAALGYAVFIGHYTLLQHYRLNTHNFDLAINDNLMYGGLKGTFMESTVAHGLHPERYLAAHAKYGGYAFLPIYYLFPRAETLIVIEATMLGLSALPLFAFARRHVSQWTAVVVALAFLAYYPMHSANFYEVKWVPVATFFVLATVWAAEAQRWVLCTLAFLVAVLMREDMPIGMAVIGTFFLLSGRRPRAGLLMALVASAWFVFIRFYVMEEAGDWWFPSMYKSLWASGEKGFGSVIKTLLSSPLFVFSKIAEKSKVIYLMHLLVPLALLPARRWYLWAAFIPGTIITLLTTNYKPITGFSFQYVMHWAPYLFLATPLALASIRRSLDDGPNRMRAAVGTLALASLVTSYNYGAFGRHEGSFKGGFSTISFQYSDKHKQRYADLKEVAARIPREASVAASERVGPQVSAREKIYTTRKRLHDADYVLVFRGDLKHARTKPLLKKALSSGRYGLLAKKPDFVLLKRGHSTKGNDAVLKDWRL